MSRFKLDKMTIKDKIGQISMYGIEGTEITDDTINLIKEYRVGNIILFARNVKSPKQLFELTQGLQKLAKAEFDIPMFISIDQEGGMVTRIFDGSTFFPGAMTISATNKLENSYNMGRIMGKELNAMGINMNLAPILDVNNNPKNPVIGVRSFSDKPKVVAEYSWQFARGLQEEHVFATGKHFPGHGDTNVDSHLGLPTINHDLDVLEHMEFVPFRYNIDNGIKGIMSSHINFSKLTKDGIPATLSKEVMTDLLRDDFGFKGLLVSDSMTMKGVIQKYSAEEATLMAINAGIDLTCLCHPESPRRETLEYLYEAVEDGRLKEESIDILLNRVLKAKEELININLDNKFTDIENIVINTEHKNQAYQVVEDALTLVKGENIKLKEKTLFIGYKPRALTIADDTDGTSKLENILNKEIPEMDTIILNLKPNEKDISAIMNKIEEYDQIILTTYAGNTNSEQIDLINRIHEKHEDVSVISMRDPYDLYFTDKIKNYICIYEYTPNSIKVITKYLKGEITPNGVIPIKYE